MVKLYEIVVRKMYGRLTVERNGRINWFCMWVCGGGENFHKTMYCGMNVTIIWQAFKCSVNLPGVTESCVIFIVVL